MDKLVAAIEKQQGKFEKISTNNYMMAIKDGFIATMPLIMFSSFLMIIIMIPKKFRSRVTESSYCLDEKSVYVNHGSFGYYCFRDCWKVISWKC